MAVNLYHPSLTFARKTVDYTTELLTRFHSSGMLLASPENVRLGCKLLTVTNTTAYYATEVIKGSKSFLFRLWFYLQQFECFSHISNQIDWSSLAWNQQDRVMVTLAIAKFVPQLCLLFGHAAHHSNEAARFKNVNNYLNTNIYSYLDTSTDQSSNIYWYVVHFFNTSIN